jgi:hypothetical protein
MASRAMIHPRCLIHSWPSAHSAPYDSQHSWLSDRESLMDDSVTHGFKHLPPRPPYDSSLIALFKHLFRPQPPSTPLSLHP